jgi:hypothetical protein
MPTVHKVVITRIIIIRALIQEVLEDTQSLGCPRLQDKRSMFTSGELVRVAEGIMEGLILIGVATAVEGVAPQMCELEPVNIPPGSLWPVAVVEGATTPRGVWVEAIRFCQIIVGTEKLKHAVVVEATVEEKSRITIIAAAAPALSLQMQIRPHSLQV